MYKMTCNYYMVIKKLANRCLHKLMKSDEEKKWNISKHHMYGVKTCVILLGLCNPAPNM